MSTVSYMKYLWEATFADGHVISQPSDDRYSKHDDAADHNPSAFRDILDYGEKSPLVSFALIGDGERWAVDLTSGKFSHNGVSFDLAPQGFSISRVPVQLVYFREVKKDTDFEATVQENGTDVALGEPLAERHYISKYYFGWQAVGIDLVCTIAVN